MTLAMVIFAQLKVCRYRSDLEAIGQNELGKMMQFDFSSPVLIILMGLRFGRLEIL